MWCHPEFDATVNAAIATDDIDERKAFYQTANEIIAREIPLMPIAHAYRYSVHNDNIQGLTINPYGGIRFANVRESR
jgi:cationic peptide transport system substrate-binding protein